MKQLLTVVTTIALVTFAPFTSFAQAAAPSPESVERLLIVTKTDKMIDSMLQNMEGMISGMADKMRPSGEDTPEAKAKRDNAMRKMLPIMKEELSWDKMKSMYTQIYSESFNQVEIDGLIAFYNSPAGIAFVNKMPLVMQKSMTLTQERMGPMMQKIEALMKKEAEEAAAAK